MGFVTDEGITGSGSLNMGASLSRDADCLCKLDLSLQNRMLKDACTLAANLGLYHIYFRGFNGHGMGPESCLHLILML